jgi:hypothetical protein
MKTCLLLALSTALALGCTPVAAPPGRASAPADTPRTPASDACPAADFEGFLRAFAADPQLRMRYTAPFVQVTDWIDADETQLGTETVSVARGEYADFKLRYRDGAYAHIEHAAKPDPIPVDPRITPAPGGYRVEYIFNMSEGNSWTFRRAGDCWQLSEDPDPSLL